MAVPVAFTWGWQRSQLFPPAWKPVCQLPVCGGLAWQEVQVIGPSVHLGEALALA